MPFDSQILVSDVANGIYEGAALLSEVAQRFHKWWTSIRSQPKSFIFCLRRSSGIGIVEVANFVRLPWFLLTSQLIRCGWSVKNLMTIEKVISEMWFANVVWNSWKILAIFWSMKVYIGFFNKSWKSENQEWSLSRRWVGVCSSYWVKL